MSLTVTNPANSAESYIFGTRGRAPKWLTEGLAAGTVKVPEGYKSAKEKAAETAPKTPKVEKSAEKQIAKLNKKLQHANNKLDTAKKHVASEQTVVDALTAEIAALKNPVAVTEDETETVVITDDAPKAMTAAG
jgi:peptidoglycan hydrolase CwlO-like protein